MLTCRVELRFKEEDICGITKQILDYTETQYVKYLDVITEEIKLETFISGRIHSLGFYAQQIKDDSKSSFTVVFTEVHNSLDELPDELRILLVNNKDDVIALNCDYGEILVRDGNEKYIGQFVLDEEIANERLLRYRRYKKDACDGMIAFINHAKKNNPIKPYFMSGKTIQQGFKEPDKSN